MEDDPTTIQVPEIVNLPVDWRYNSLGWITIRPDLADLMFDPQRSTVTSSSRGYGLGRMSFAFVLFTPLRPSCAAYLCKSLWYREKFSFSNMHDGTYTNTFFFLVPLPDSQYSYNAKFWNYCLKIPASGFSWGCLLKNIC